MRGKGDFMSGLRTIDEIAPILRVAPVTIRRLIKRGELPFTKVGKRYLFSEKNISTFIAYNEGNSKEATQD